MRSKWLKIGIVIELLILPLCLFFAFRRVGQSLSVSVQKKDFIKWVDFNISYEALCAAYEYDVETYKEPVHVEWIPLLAYTAARTGGNFSKDTLSLMKDTKEKLCAKEVTIENLTKNLKYYNYYLEAYDAVLHNYVGEYTDPKNTTTSKAYGLKVFSPIAKGFAYSDYDDFGSSRSYGYSRPHLGHDMMGLIGTPIIAVAEPWKHWDGISTEAGASAYEATTPDGTIITHICARIVPTQKDLKKVTG